MILPPAPSSRQSLLRRASRGDLSHPVGCGHSWCLPYTDHPPVLGRAVWNQQQGCVRRTQRKASRGSREAPREARGLAVGRGGWGDALRQSPAPLIQSQPSWPVDWRNVDEVRLTERLIEFDSSTSPGLENALDFVEGCLAGAGVHVERRRLGDRDCLISQVGAGGPRLIFNGHIDVVPGHAEQFVPRIDGDRLIGRGAYDMKGALACMILAMGDIAALGLDATVELMIVPDEERSDPGPNCTEMLVDQGLRGDFVICGEPTDLHVGVQAKGVLMVRAVATGVAAHGSTPWLGRSAILDGVALYRAIEGLPFASESTELFARPSINLGRISGGDAINKVPDECILDIDIRYLPGQDPDEIIEQIRGLGNWEVEVVLERIPASVDPGHPFVRNLCDAACAFEPSAVSVGRDGASDAVAFLAADVPAVEFGPRGRGHHGPDEYVEISSLRHYRGALVEFARRLGSPGASVDREVTTA